VRRRRRGRSWLAGLVVAGVGGAVLAGAVVWWRPATSRTGVDLGRPLGGVRPGDLNVLVVTFDTTRADRLGCYGYPDAGTPAVDRLAADGVVFDAAVSAAPLTLPAHATIFTGTRPPVHGVRDNGGYVLGEGAVTLAEVLKGAGWRTGAFVGAYVLDAKWGLDQGFDVYFDQFAISRYRTLSLGAVSRRAGAVVDAALPWLDQNAATKFFAWLHFYDPHSPYDPPEPFKSRFAGRPYQGEIAYADAELGRVLDWLARRGLADRTIVVVMGDHGESLMEHGEGTHGLFVYDATVRVPLVIRAPFARTRGRRVAAVVRSEDVLPTILDLVGLDPPHAVQGRSLLPLLTGAARELDLEAYSESLYARNHFGWSELRALRVGRYKYIEAPRPELYDLERDPRELTNLYETRRDLAARLARGLARVGAEGSDGTPPNPGAVDPETRERLAALGYIGTFVHRAPRPREQRPDPKDKIDVFNLLVAAQESGERESGAHKIARLERVIALDPEVVDAWVMLGNEYVKQGEVLTGVAHYRRALALNPESDLALINLANAYRRLGDYQAAILGYERYLERDPRNAYVRYQLGELYFDLGALDRAALAFRAALALDDRVAAARTALGVVALRRGDLDTAEREIRAALAQQPDVRLAHFNLALVAEARGDLETAEREYRAEIEGHPTSYKAAFNLGRLYERLGRPLDQVRAYRQAVEMNPAFAEGYLYLAKWYLDRGERYEEAVALARRGLALGPSAEFAPLGHYVLADLFNRLGRFEEARGELAKGRALEARARRAQAAARSRR
jgi:arylsulfatase A-like enzyme/Tfp pilus assembly protein PilF